jgi:pimeloyl-ACP methyl ester carboxylesterase
MSVITEPSPILVFIIHGFTSSTDADWLQSIKDNLLNYYAQTNTTANVITVDWSQLAAAIQDWGDFWNNPIYIKSAMNTRDIVAPTLHDLISAIPSKFVMCIGHSLGAQTCGAFGRLMNANNKSIDVIHGLDPAGPLFDNGYYNLTNLNKADAKFVSAIHSDTNYLSSLLGGIHLGTGVRNFLFFLTQ